MEWEQQIFACEHQIGHLHWMDYFISTHAYGLKAKLVQCRGRKPTLFVEKSREISGFAEKRTLWVFEDEFPFQGDFQVPRQSLVGVICRCIWICPDAGVIVTYAKRDYLKFLKPFTFIVGNTSSNGAIFIAMFVYLSYKIMVSQIAGPFLEDDLGKSITPHLWSIWLLTTPFEACDMSNITFLLNLRNSPPLVVAYVLLKIHHIEQNIHPVGQVAPKTQGEQWHQCLWTSRTLVQCHPTFRVSHCTVALRNHWKRVLFFLNRIILLYKDYGEDQGIEIIGYIGIT